MKKPSRRSIVLLLTLQIVAVILALAACTPSPVSSDSASVSDTNDRKTDSAALELSAWTEDSDCGSCHVGEMESALDPNCIYSLHSTTDCIVCHTNTDDSLTAAHANSATNKLPAKLKATEVTNNICTACHNLDDVKTATAGVSVLTDSNGTTVNPHDLPQTESHLNSVFCSDCHKQHKADSIEETAKQTCLKCHHADVYECDTCHK